MIRLYKNTDTGANNALNNAAGKLIDVLDQVLVNGYSIGTVVSITRSGNLATVTMSQEHGLLGRGDVINIGGAEQAEYNGERYVRVINPTQFTFEVTGEPATPATGTLTARKEGAGWTKPFSDTNKAAYRQGGGSQFYLRVDDTGTSSARAVGYESMSSIDDTTGNAFPTNAQFAGGLHLSKSNGSATRDWIVIATDRYFYLWVLYPGYDTSAPLSFFGNYDAYFTTAFNAAFIAGTSAAGSGAGNQVSSLSTGASSLAGNYVARNRSDAAGSIGIMKIGPGINGIIAGSSGFSYPEPISGGLLYAPIEIGDAGVSGIMGALPGALAPAHNRPLDHLDTFDGSGDYAGQVFAALSCWSYGQVFVRVE